MVLSDANHFLVLCFDNKENMNIIVQSDTCAMHSVCNRWRQQFGIWVFQLFEFWKCSASERIATIETNILLWDHFSCDLPNFTVTINKTVKHFRNDAHYAFHPTLRCYDLLSYLQWQLINYFMTGHCLSLQEDQMSMS